MPKKRDLWTDVLKLPRSAQARLHRRLGNHLSLTSSAPNQRSEAEWDAEIAKRADEILSGKVETVDAFEMISQVRAEMLRARASGISTSEKGAVLQQALRLAPDDRLELAQALLDSLPPDAGWDEAWVAELVRRGEDVASGRVKTIPAEEVMAELKARADGGGKVRRGKRRK